MYNTFERYISGFQSTGMFLLCVLCARVPRYLHSDDICLHSPKLWDARGVNSGMQQILPGHIAGVSGRNASSLCFVASLSRIIRLT